MSISVKIRILLALLCASLMFTAFIIGQYYTPADNLNQSVKTLEGNLHKKEKWINRLLEPREFEKLKTLTENQQEATKLIDNYMSQKRIWLITLLNGKINFWSGVKVIPDDAAAIKEGISFIRQPNAYYEVIKKSEGNFSALFFIPIKNDYQLTNPYLNKKFDRDILPDNNLEIADITDTKVQAIRTLNKSYLFSVKLRGQSTNHLFLGFEIMLWAASLLILCLLVHFVGQRYAYKNRIWTGLGLLALFIIVLRCINLYLHYPAVFYELSIFNPIFFHSNVWFPSLGDLCINVLLLTWFASFAYYYRQKLLNRALSSAQAYSVLVAGICILAYVLTQLLTLFADLVANTSINFDVDNILNLSGFSVIAVIMLCFCLLVVFLLTEAFLTICKRLAITEERKLYVLLTCIALITTYSTWQHHSFTLLFILWSIPVMVREYSVVHYNGRYSPFSFLSIIILFALITAVKFIGFQTSKEKELRKALLYKLENNNDTAANQRFKTLEKRIVNDPILPDYFVHRQYNSDYLKTYFQSNYFNGYLAGYSLKVNEFDAKGNPVSSGNQFALSDFKAMVMYSSFKVSGSFYRENDAFGFKSYFSIIPVYQQNTLLGTVIIELKSKPLQLSYSFPQILANNQPAAGHEFKGYSYAFYNNNHLLSQSGKYLYNIINNQFKGKLKEYTFENTRENNAGKPWIQQIKYYSHLVYQPSKRKLIIITREESAFEGMTTLTFFFVVLLTFSMVVLAVVWVVARVKILSIRNNHLVWGFRIRFNRVLYQTRIQLFMILAVVLTLILVGIITYISIRSQYIDQQDETMSEKAIRVAAAFEAEQTSQLQNFNSESQVKFNEFANNFSTDLELYNLNGMLVITTQPQIYNLGLLARRINGKAYLQLHSLQKSVVINDEKIGDLAYKSAYAPVRNSNNVTIGYLQLPYFSNEADYRQQIGSLLNAMINIYALIFIVIGLLAVVIARQITAPLAFIQQSLRRTIYGQKNEPIAWVGNDEIGALVKEYNNMIAQLDQSAVKLAQSERESAWREMAKQVAHEIKNPLTPLKLGLQLLEKSWKDKDAKFDAKFERFSKSFVEQIDSLSTIASEFSAFAKMPDTRMSRIDVLETLNQAVTIFKHMENIKINYFHTPGEEFFIMADRDQLLRCFNNLLKNAIEAMPPERSGIIDVTYVINNRSITLNIKDNGNGIPENLRQRIFEPNFTTKSSGTGLGLAFVKNSIENAGGKISFETETAVGTNFHLSFPKAIV